MDITIVAASVVSFATSLLLIPKLIKFLKSVGMVGIDVQKPNKPEVAEMGGPAVISGFLAGMFLFIWLNVFAFSGNLLSPANLAGIFAGMSTILLIMVIGMFDDMTRLQKKSEGVKGFERYKRVGWKQWQKPLLTLPAAIPLMAIMAGNSTMSIPLLGVVDLGILYPLLIVPAGVVGASNAVNMLAGFNGLEAGMGFVTLVFMGIFGYINGELAAASIAFVMAAAVLAFLRYNWYPARILPGDSFVYAMGAAMAVIAIIGNMEKFALYIFTPWIIELALKLRSGLAAENYGVLRKGGILKPKYDKPYSLTHVVMMSGDFKEWQVSAILICVQVVVCAASLLLVSGFVLRY
ncbi:MAG: hypothetical protein HYS53_01025 [Candidatus Aenigmarchaeota archaeon]|nr:hypothetical protein [Candidatus Aenigmarchaeota archaeon]